MGLGKTFSKVLNIFLSNFDSWTQLCKTCCLTGLQKFAEDLRAKLPVDVWSCLAVCIIGLVRFVVGCVPMRCLCIRLIWLIDIVLEELVRFSFGGERLAFVRRVRLLTSPRIVRLVLGWLGGSSAFCMLVALYCLGLGGTN